jgi:hypothetical protein
MASGPGGEAISLSATPAQTELLQKRRAREARVVMLKNLFI